MRPIVLMSTYNLSNADQWDLCRMLERANVSEFDFVVLEDLKGTVDDLLNDLSMYKEEPIVVTLDDAAIKFAHNYLTGSCRIIDWYKPSLSYVPPKVNGQQLATVLLEDERHPD